MKSIQENIAENFHEKEICSSIEVFLIKSTSQALAKRFCESCDEKNLYSVQIGTQTVENIEES